LLELRTKEESKIKKIMEDLLYEDEQEQAVDADINRRGSLLKEQERKKGKLEGKKDF